jgi:hypothetical protein
MTRTASPATRVIEPLAGQVNQDEFAGEYSGLRGFRLYPYETDRELAQERQVRHGQRPAGRVAGGGSRRRRTSKGYVLWPLSYAQLNPPANKISVGAFGGVFLFGSLALICFAAAVTNAVTALRPAMTFTWLRAG